jgi:hypothetical protein
MSINRETWTRCREDYICGRGSLAAVAARHGVAKSTVEKRALSEEWTRLRREFEKFQLEKLLPPALPTPPLAPIAPGGSISDEWLNQRVEIHYRKNTELLDKTRALLDAKLTASEKPSADELGKLTSALSGLVSAEIALLGLNRRKDKRRRPSASPVEIVQVLPDNGTIPTHEP